MEGFLGTSLQIHIRARKHQEHYYILCHSYLRLLVGVKRPLSGDELRESQNPSGQEVISRCQCDRGCTGAVVNNV